MGATKVHDKYSKRRERESESYTMTQCKSLADVASNLQYKV